MTAEERLANVERELAEAKAQATRAKRRNRWLLVALKILTSNWRSIAEAVGRLFGQKKE